jgi:phage-related protein
LEITYYKTPSGREPVMEYLATLQAQDRESIATDFKLIIKYGIFSNIVLTRKLHGDRFGNRLWEIKTGLRHQQRIFYCLTAGPTLVMLHACKKQKEAGQMTDIMTAYNRMKEVLS